MKRFLLIIMAAGISTVVEGQIRFDQVPDTVRGYYMQLVFSDKDTVVHALRYWSEFGEWYELNRDPSLTMCDSTLFVLYHKESKEFRSYVVCYESNDAITDTILIDDPLVGQDLTVDTIFFKNGITVVPRGDNDWLRRLKNSFWNHQLRFSDTVDYRIKYFFEVSRTHDEVKKEVLSQYCRVDIDTENSPVRMKIHCVDCLQPDVDYSVQSKTALIDSRSDERQLRKGLKALVGYNSVYCLNWGNYDRIILKDAEGNEIQFYFSEAGIRVPKGSVTKAPMRLHQIITYVTCKYFELQCP